MQQMFCYAFFMIAILYAIDDLLCIFLQKIEDPHVIAPEREAMSITLLVGKTRSAFTCSKLTMKTLEQGVKYVQS